MIILSTVITNAANVAMGMLLLAFFLAFWRLVKGPSLPDRVVVLDLIASLVIGITLAITFLSGEKVYLNVAVMIALITFMGTVAFAIYLKKQYDDK
jgi:multicomponent Na+:H+ antiporter subunit F